MIKIIYLNLKTSLEKLLGVWIPLLLFLISVIVGPISVAKTETLNWTIGLYCRGNLPDPKLDSFFIVEQNLRFIRVAQFNNDMVDFSMPAIELEITPKELFNRPEGLTINRETLAMKWRNSKKICKLEKIEKLEILAQEHLIFLLKDNKL